MAARKGIRQRCLADSNKARITANCNGGLPASIGLKLIKSNIGMITTIRRLNSRNGRRKAKLLFCACLFASAATVASQTGLSNGMQSAKRNSRKLSTQWSPALHLKNLADIPARLNQPFEDTFEGTSGGKPVTISNCSDYLRFSKQGLKAAKEREYSVLHLNGVDCVAIDLLQTAKPAHSSFLSNFQIKRESLDVLPPELAPAVSRDTAAEVHAADIAGKSWKTYAKDVRVTNGAGPSQIVVTERNWTTRVTEYGRADFTGDGVEDLLVRTDTAATQGTYGNAQLFILSRKSNGGRLTFERAVPVP